MPNIIRSLVIVFLGVGCGFAQAISLHLFAKGGKYGYKDDDGVVQISPHLDRAGEFRDGLAPVGVITGEALYDGGQAGKGCHIKTAKWGYIGPGGRWVIQPVFDEAEEFHEGLAAVTFTGGKTGGYVDTSGKIVFRTSLPERGAFQGGIALVRDSVKGTNLIVDHTGKIRFSQARDLKVIGEGLVRFSESYDGPFGIEDSDGKVLVAPEFEELGFSSEGLIAAMKNKKWGFIDRVGKVVIPGAFDDRGWDAGTKVYGFHEGLSAVYQKGKFGYVDHTGKLVIQARFADAGPFNAGLAYACIALNTVHSEREARYPLRFYRQERKL